MSVATPTEKGDRLLESGSAGGFVSGSELKEASSTRPPASARSTGCLRAALAAAAGRWNEMVIAGEGFISTAASSLGAGFRLRPKLRYRRGLVRRTVTRRIRRWKFHPELFGRTLSAVSQGLGSGFPLVLAGAGPKNREK